MSGGKAATVRAVALSGPSGAGKTTLLEAMLNASGRLTRRGSVGLGTALVRLAGSFLKVPNPYSRSQH